MFLQLRSILRSKHLKHAVTEEVGAPAYDIIQRHVLKRKSHPQTTGKPTWIMSANVSTFFKAVNQNSGIPLASSALRQTLENQNSMPLVVFPIGFGEKWFQNQKKMKKHQCCQCSNQRVLKH